MNGFIIGLDNELSPMEDQVIVWTNDEVSFMKNIPQDDIHHNLYKNLDIFICEIAPEVIIHLQGDLHTVPGCDGLI